MANKESKESTALVSNDLDQEFLQSIGGNEVLSDLGANDFVLPRYRLIQNTSRTGTPGKWVSNLNPTVEMDSLKMVVLKVTNFRTYFPPAGGGDKPLCRSNDGVHKADAGMIGDAKCANCRYAVWTNNANGKNDPPPCGSGYNFFGIILLPDGSSELGSVAFKRSAIKPCKQYFTKMRARGVAPFVYVTEMASVSETNEKGRFYRPEFIMGENLTKDEILAASNMAKQYSDIFTSSSGDDYEDERETSSSSTGSQAFIDSLGGNAANSSSNDLEFI